MVSKITNETSLSRSGLRDWLIQRLTAIMLAVYTVFLVSYLIVHSPLQYSDWHALFSNGFMRIFTILTLLSMVYHTWVGIWTVLTDYIHAPRLRLTIYALVIFVLLGYLLWGIAIVIL